MVDMMSSPNNLMQMNSALGTSSESQNQSQQWQFKQLLPVVSTSAKMFYGIIRANILGDYSQMFLMFIEHVILIVVSARLNNFSTFLDDDHVYPEINLKKLNDTSKYDLYVQNNLKTILITSGVLNGVFLSIFFALFYLYRLLNTTQENKKVNSGSNGGHSQINEGNNTASIILNRVLAFIFLTYQSLFGLLAQFFVSYAIYWISFNASSIQNSTIMSIILMTMIAVLQFQLLFLSFIERTFINLQFQNQQLPSSRQTAGDLIDYSQPAFCILLTYMTMNVNMSANTRLINLIVLALAALGILFKSSITFTYFNHTINKVDMWMKVGSTSFHWSQIAVLAINKSETNEGERFKELMLIWAVFAIVLLGLSIFMMSWREKRVQRRLLLCNNPVSTDRSLGNSSLSMSSSNDRLDGRDQKLIEQGAYMIYDLLDSQSPYDQRKLQSLMLVQEEYSALYWNQEDLCYLDVISKILNEDEGDLLDANKQQDLYANDDQSQGGEANGDDPFSRTQNSEKDDNSSKNARKGYLMSFQQSGEFTQSIQYLDKKTLIRVNQQPLSPVNIMGSGTQQNRYDAEGLQHHQLADIFQNDIAKKNQINLAADEPKSQIEIALKILKMGSGVDLSQISEEEAIKFVKIRYVYNVIAKRVSAFFSNSLTLMFYKALLAIERLNNKYLTLTTITHINLYAKRRLSYFRQIQSRISEAYFVDRCIENKIQNSYSQERDLKLTSGKSKQYTGMEEQKAWTENEREIDPNVLLQQSIEVETIHNKIRNCTVSIAQFWQLYNSEALSTYQLDQFIELSENIAQNLQQIKAHADIIETQENCSSKSDLLCMQLSQFYLHVLRDKKKGQKIASRIEQNNIFQTKDREFNSARAGTIDQIGVMVVDGNFDLYGKIIFGNKLILKALGFRRPEEIINKTVHKIIPRVVADHHNFFWKNFAAVGEPKVLDSVRFLFAKDSRGYLQPLKILIRFQYTQQFGYCFVGLFKQPSQIIFNIQERPVKLADTYTLLCSQNGKILDLSESCKTLFGLTPAILEQLHAVLQENFQVSCFNEEELQIKLLDFKNNTCIFFKSISLDFTKLYEYMQNLEIEEDLDEERDPDTGKLIKSTSTVVKRLQFQATMKIIKEIYGEGSIPEPIVVYYVIFSEAQEDHSLTKMLRDQQSQEEIGSVLGSQASLNLMMRAKKKSFQEEEEKKDAASNKNSQMNDDQLTRTSSAGGSSSGSTNNTSEYTIKVIDDGIEDVSTPNALIGLKLASSGLIFELIVLSVVQYLLNSNYDTINKQNQKILIQSVQNYEYSSQLELLTRSYLNMNIGLEPLNSTYVQNRQEQYQNVSLNLIDLMRENLEVMKLFLEKNKILDTEYTHMTLYSLLPNRSIEIRDAKRFFGINLWLVQLDQLFAFPQFQSTVGTYAEQYLVKVPFQEKQASIYDQIAFFVFENAQQDLFVHLDNMITEQNSQIVYQTEHGLKVNQIFAIVSAVVILLSTFLAVYLTVRALAFKHAIVQFFDKLNSVQIVLLEKCAHFFLRVLVDPEDIQNLEKIEQEFDEYKQKLNEDKQLMQKFLVQRSVSTALGGGKVTLESLMKQTNIRKKKGGKDRKSVQIKVQNAEDSKKKIQAKRRKGFSLEDEKKNPFGIKDQGGTNKLQSRNSLRKKSQEEEKKEESDSFSEDETPKKKSPSSKKPEDLIPQEPDQSKARQLFILMNQRRQRMTVRLFALAVVLTGFLIIYFVTQYLLFEKQTIQFENNAIYLSDLIKTVECQESLISDIRTIQTSNFTQYNLDNKYQKIHTKRINSQFLSTLNQTFLSCIKQNQKVQNWIQTYNDGEFYLNGTQNLCNTYLNNVTNCEDVYQGILKKSTLQSTSLFMQDSMYSLIKFVSRVSLNQTTLQQEFLAKQAMIELIDAHVLYQQKGLRALYHQVVNKVLTSQSTNSSTITLFVVFISVLLFFGIVVQWFVFMRVRKWFWNSLYLLQLLPRDDLDKEFIKSINDFLKSS